MKTDPNNGSSQFKFGRRSSKEQRAAGFEYWAWVRGNEAAMAKIEQHLKMRSSNAGKPEAARALAIMRLAHASRIKGIHTVVYSRFEAEGWGVCSCGLVIRKVAIEHAVGHLDLDLAEVTVFICTLLDGTSVVVCQGCGSCTAVDEPTQASEEKELIAMLRHGKRCRFGPS